MNGYLKMNVAVVSLCGESLEHAACQKCSARLEATEFFM